MESIVIMNHLYYWKENLRELNDEISYQPLAGYLTDLKRDWYKFRNRIKNC